MRNYNYLIMLSLLVYVLLAAGIGLVNQNVTGKNEQYYKVEINRIMAKIKSLEDIDKINTATGLTRVKIIAADGPADYMRQVLRNMDEETFQIFIDYHLSTCERADLLGASAHTLDILQNV